MVPYDIRIPKVRIGTRQAHLLRSHRVVVRIDSWTPHSLYPDGHFVRSVGLIGDMETETAVIMIEHGLLRPSFSRSLLNGQSVSILYVHVCIYMYTCTLYIIHVRVVSGASCCFDQVSFFYTLRKFSPARVSAIQYVIWSLRN